MTSLIKNTCCWINRVRNKIAEAAIVRRLYSRAAGDKQNTDEHAKNFHLLLWNNYKGNGRVVKIE